MNFLNNAEFKNFDDNTLCVLSKKGDERAFEEITIRYIKLIYSIAQGYSADGYEVEDFVQEGLLSFLLASKSYDIKSGASFKNYAVKCAKNRFSDIIKKTYKKSTVPSSKIVSMDNLTVKEENDNSQNVEDYVLEREYLKTLLSHLYSLLTVQEREIFSLYVNGYSYSDIAEKLSSTPKAVDNTLQKIKRKLRTQ